MKITCFEFELKLSLQSGRQFTEVWTAGFDIPSFGGAEFGLKFHGCLQYCSSEREANLISVEIKGYTVVVDFLAELTLAAALQFCVGAAE